MQGAHTRMNYYNEFDPFAAAWLRCVVADEACTNDDCGYAAAVYTGTAYN